MHPTLRAKSGTRFPLKTSAGNGIPSCAGIPGQTFRQSPQTESASQNSQGNDTCLPDKPTKPPLGTSHAGSNAKKGARANADALVQGRDINQPRYRTRDQLLVVELVVVAAVLEVVLGDQLVVAREAVGGQHGQDPGRHDDAEVVVQARDRVLGGVDDDNERPAVRQDALDANSCRYIRRRRRG